MQVQLHHARDVRAIHGRENPFRTRQRAKLLRRQHHTRHRWNVAEKHYPRSRRDRVIKKIQHRSRIRHRLRQRHFFHHDPVAFRFQIPRMLTTGMLLVGHQHFFAGLHIQPIGDVAVGLRRVSQQREFIAIATYERRHRIAKLVPRRVPPDRIVLRIALRHFFRFVVAIENRAQHRHRRGAHRPVVQIDLVRRDKKLFPQLAPIRLLVRSVERGVRQFWCFLFEQRGPFTRQVQRTRCSRETSERRQESAAVHHHVLQVPGCANSTREPPSQQPAFATVTLAGARASVYRCPRQFCFERPARMQFSKWVLASIFALSIGSSVHLTAQQKTSKKPVATAPATPVDEVVNTLFATRRFEQTAISPDGKKIAWVETLVGKDGAPDGNTAIYITDRDTSAAPKRITAAALNLARAEGSLDWSPDSKQLAFLSDAVKPGQLQLYVVSPSGGAARKFTSVKGLLATPRWSPDGKTIAVLFTENATRAAGP